MIKDSNLKYIVGFILLILLQVLVLDKISFLGYAIPFLYIYFFIKLPIAYSRNLTLLWAFLMGFIIDIFCSTPGINAAATVLIAILLHPLQRLFFISDDYKGEVPSIGFLGSNFMKYAITITFIHNIALALIEAFSFFNIKLIVLRIICSTIITLLFIFAFEGFSKKKKRNSWKTKI